MKRILLYILFILFFTVKGIAQKNSNTSIDQISVGSKLFIDALPYTNDINKYYFNKEEIDELAAYLKKHANLYVEINCYSDFIDPSLMNLMATAEQAMEIRTYLVTKGIEGSRVETIGNGDMYPIYEEYELDKMTPEKRAEASLKNRRIKVKFVKL